MGFVFSLSTKVLIEIPTYPFIGPIGYIIIKTQNNLNSPEVVISQRFYKIVNQNNCGYAAWNFKSTFLFESDTKCKVNNL